MEKSAGSINQMRIIHVVFIVASALYAYLGEQYVGKNVSGVPTATLYGVIIAAGFDGLIAYYFRRTKLFPALEKLHRDSMGSAALNRWRFATILSMVLALSISLYGFALRFLGAPRRVSWSFYSVAFILLLLWRPKLDLAAEPARLAGNQ